jgi:hypothetical protein
MLAPLFAVALSACTADPTAPTSETSGLSNEVRVSTYEVFVPQGGWGDVWVFTLLAGTDDLRVVQPVRVESDSTRIRVDREQIRWGRGWDDQNRPIIHQTDHFMLYGREVGLSFLKSV